MSRDKLEKQKIIAITSIFIIVIIVSFSLLNIYALGNLKLSGIDNKFRLFEMSTDDKIRICNNSPIPAFFNQFVVLIYFEDEPLGTFIVDSATIMPNSGLDLEGNYISNSVAQSQSLFMHFDHMFSSDNTIRIDPRKMIIGTEFQTSIIGIPYSVSEQYTSFDFWNMLNSENNLKC